MENNQVLKIFVVEDNLIYQQLIARELAPLTTDIHFFTRGESCLDALSLSPSIIVLDFNLEGLLNGLDTMKSIKFSHPEIYIVLFSSETEICNEENFSHYGLFDFVEKKETTFSRLREKIISQHLAC